MKLLCITSHGDTLNSIRPEAEQMIAMARMEADVTVMAQASSPYKEVMVNSGINFIDFLPEKKLSLSTIKTIRSELKKNHYDAVYSFNNKAISNTNIAAIGLPVVVVNYRGQTGNINKFDPAAYLTHLHPRVDLILCVANAVRDSLRAQCRHPETIQTAYKGHKLDWYSETPADLTEFGIEKSDFTVICVANNRPRKGLLSLVKASYALKADNIHLLLVGADLDESELQQAISDSPMSKRIHCAGHRHDATALVAACQASILPALKREGLPKTVIEAMAYGVAPIVTDTGGNAELVIHQECGIVVAPGDSQAIAKAITQLHESPTLTTQYGKAAKLRIGEHFTVEAGARQTLEAIKQATERKGTSD